MKKILSIFAAVLFTAIMAGSASALVFSWENDPGYASGAILPDGTVSKLETVLEMKAPGETAWTQIITATDGAATATYTAPTGIKSGDVYQFRAYAQIKTVIDTAGTVGILKSEGYSNIVSYQIPYVPGPNPADPKNLTISIEVAGQTYKIIIPPAAVN